MENLKLEEMAQKLKDLEAQYKKVTAKQFIASIFANLINNSRYINHDTHMRIILSVPNSNCKIKFIDGESENSDVFDYFVSYLPAIGLYNLNGKYTCDTDVTQELHEFGLYLDRESVTLAEFFRDFSVKEVNDLMSEMKEKAAKRVLDK